MLHRLDRIAVALAAALAGASVSLAQETPSTWNQVLTKDFRVIGHEAPERVEELAIAAQRTLAVLERVAPAEGAPPLEPMTLFAFGSNESFALLGNSINTAGFLVPHPHGVFAAFVSGNEPTRQIHRQVVLHLVSSRYPTLPEWFRQGIAEVYSNIEIDNGSLVIGKPIRMHLMFLRSPANKLSVSALLEQPKDWKGGIPGYAIHSWALVHYLVFSDPALRKQIPVYLDLIAGLERPRRAFETAFDLTPEQVGQRVRTYLEAGEMPFGRVEIGALPAVATTSRQLSRTEASLAFANLAVHTEQPPSERTLTSLLKLESVAGDRSSYWTLRGETERELGRPDAADRSLGRAVEIEPTNFKAQLLLGETKVARLQAIGADVGLSEVEAAAATLRQAADLRADSQAVWEGLSFVYASHPQPPLEAVDAARKALHFQPGRADLVFNLLLIYAKQGETDQVREQLTRLAALGADPKRVTQAREMLLQMILRDTREPMRAGQLEDVVAMLSEVRARTVSDELRATADEWLERVRSVQEYNNFTARYNAAVEAYNTNDWDRSLILLDELAAAARSEGQKLAVHHLRREVQYWRD